MWEVNLKKVHYLGVRVWVPHSQYGSVLLQGLCNGCQSKVGTLA
jgi:hypothetical protein